MLFGTSRACVVDLHGSVYIGGGHTDSDEDKSVIQVHSHVNKQWCQLPKCPVEGFAMAVVNQQLVLVGGYSHSGCMNSTILVWNSTSTWTSPHPDMPTARWAPAAVGYQHFLLVAGGRTSSSNVNTVEILNSSTKRWVTASPLPRACNNLTAALIGDTLYFLGGDLSLSPNKQMFSISLPCLISHAMSASHTPPPIWDVIHTELTLSTAVTLHNHLLALGGKDDRNRRSSAVYLYNHQIKHWKKVGHLPDAILSCAVTVLSSGELLVLGGWSESGHSKKMYAATVK